MKKAIYLMAFALVLGTIGCKKSSPTSPTSNASGNARYIAGGKGGSMARFAIIDNYMYSVDFKTLKIFDITDGMNPKYIAKRDLLVGAETIFPQNDKLFIGTQNGLYIYNVTNPVQPTKESYIEHVVSCDPVVADETHAYVTLRGGSACGNNLNLLDVYDVTDPQDPQLRTSSDMASPYGLGLSEATSSTLFVCDGDSGLVVMSLTGLEPLEVNRIHGIKAYDVIPDGDRLIVSAGDRIIQYDVTDPMNFNELSVINVY